MSSLPASGGTSAGGQGRSTSSTYSARRFWLVVLLFAVANVAAWVGYARLHELQRRDLLVVERFTPGDNAAVTEVRPTLAWGFNMDVEPGAGGPRGPFAPKVAGDWKWADAKTLTFVPKEDLPKATRYVVTLAMDRLRTREGFVLGKAAGTGVATFTTPGLELLDVRQVRFDDESNVVLELEFSDKVLPSEVLRHLTVNPAGQGPTFSRRLSRNGTLEPVSGLAVRPFGEPTAGKIVRVQVALASAFRYQHHGMIEVVVGAGLAPTSGPLAMELPAKREIEVAAELAATGIEAEVPTGGSVSLVVEFNNDVKTENVQGLISVEPKVDFTVSSHYRGLELSGDFLPATRYAVKIAKAEVADAKKYPKATMLSVFVPDRASAAWFEHSQGYLGSGGNQTLLAKAVNAASVVATVERVYDNNLVGWRNRERSRSYYAHNAIGEMAHPLGSKKYVLENVKNKIEEVRISLDDLLPAVTKDEPRDGAYRITLTHEATGNGRAGDDEEERYESRAGESGSVTSIVTLSDIGLTAKRTQGGLVVWAVGLSTAKPMGNVKVRAYSNKQQLLGEGTTDGEGLARLENLKPAKDESVAVVIAEREEDGKKTGLTWLDMEHSARNMGGFETTGRAYLRGGYEAFIYTDRGVYRPGETVCLRAIVRGGDMKTPESFPVKWQIRRPDNRNYRGNVGALDGDGGAEWKVELPGDLPTGRWSVTLGLPGEAKTFGTASFQIEEFMPDRMKVGTKLTEVAGGRFAWAKKPLLVDVQGDYLFGQPAAGLQATFTGQMTPTSFASTEWNGWVFDDGANAGSVFGAATRTGKRYEAAGALDKDGHTQFEVDLNKAAGTTDAAGEDADEKEEGAATEAAGKKYEFKGPWTLAGTTSVVEAGGRAVSATDVIAVDRLPYYLGMRLKSWVAVGTAAAVEVALVKPDGKAFGEKREVTLKVYRETWNNVLTQKDGRYVYQSTRLLEPVKSLAAVKVAVREGKGTGEIMLRDGGAYVIEAYEAKTGQVATTWCNASRGGGWDDNMSRENPEKLEVSLVRGGEEKVGKIKVGETVKAVVKSPFVGELLLTVETDEVVWSKVVAMESAVVEVPVEVTGACRPNAYVCATVVRSVDANAKWRTHRAFGVQRLEVDAASWRMQIALETPPEMRPGRTLDVAIKATGPDGKPVANGAIAVVAVDEGICALTNFATPDPLAYFFGRRALGVGSSDIYSELMPEVAKAGGASAVGGDGDEFDPRHRSVVGAKRVRPVALVTAIAHTDADGNARVHFYVPAFLGQLRVMSVGYAGEVMGSGAKTVLVRSPVVAQSSFPRFAAPGDAFDVPVVVFNNTGAGGEAKVTLTVAEGGPLELADGAGMKTVAVGAMGQQVVTFGVKAGERVGVAKAHLSVQLGEEKFEEDVELPVRPAAPMVTRGDYGVATAGEPLKVTLGGGMLAGTERLDLRVTPRAVMNLPAGLEYLDQYPYGCLEQTTSKCFPLVYLSDIGERIGPGVADKERVADKVQVGITRLISMMTPDGGLAMWPGERETWVWGTVYAGHFLVEAEAAGHKVPEDLKGRVLDYLRGLLAKSLEPGDSTETQAYACYVLALAGKPNRAAMNRLGETIEAQVKAGTAEAGVNSARFFLAAAWMASGRKDLAAGMLPENLPQARTERALAGNVGSGIRDQALMLNTILAVDPGHKQAGPLAERLAEAGRKRAWYSTQDYAWAVMALGHYLRVTKDEKAYDGVELWSGGKKVAEAGKDKALTWTAAAAEGLEVRVTGAGAKAHVTWGLTGVPVVMPVEADHAMKIRRSYLREDGKPLGTEVASGTLVKVQLTLESNRGLNNVVMEDLLPAGLEIENAALATAVQHRKGDGAKGTMSVNRTEVRDDRIVVVGDMWGGTATFTYVARAVTAGTFVVPPVRGECMYDSGVNSISGGGGKLVVRAPGGKRWR